MTMTTTTTTANTMHDCGRCDGRGSMPSLDPEEWDRGVEDLCYHCGGSGRISAEMAREDAMEEAAAWLTPGASDEARRDCAEAIRAMPLAEQDLLLAWLPLAVVEQAHRAEARHRAALAARAAERSAEAEQWARARAVYLFRDAAARRLNPNYIPF